MKAPVVQHISFQDNEHLWMGWAATEESDWIACFPNNAASSVGLKWSSGGAGWGCFQPGRCSVFGKTGMGQRCSRAGRDRLRPGHAAPSVKREGNGGAEGYKITHARTARHPRKS